ncbi:MAG TPA: subtilase family serine proteinase, partial [Arthrobacter bacterium]|nr:subtilase family serine proteinase [Arthrobacter sp.]
MILELNMKYPGGLESVTRAFEAMWAAFIADPTHTNHVRSDTFQRQKVSRRLHQCVLTRQALAELIALDRAGDGQPVIFRAWPDYPLYAQIDRSAPTVKTDAA